MHMIFLLKYLLPKTQVISSNNEQSFESVVVLKHVYKNDSKLYIVLNHEIDSKYLIWDEKRRRKLS